MESLLGWTKEDVANRNSSEKQDYLQTLKVLHFHPVEIRFVQCQLFQTLKKSHGDVGLTALATRIWNSRRLAMQQTRQVLGQFSIFAPAKAQLRGHVRSGRVALGSVQC